MGFALALPSNSKTLVERVSNGKPSSLLGLVVSDEEKSLKTLASGVAGEETGGSVLRCQHPLHQTVQVLPRSPGRTGLSMGCFTHRHLSNIDC
jgi:hypothetical protein